MFNFSHPVEKHLLEKNPPDHLRTTYRHMVEFDRKVRMSLTPVKVHPSEGNSKENLKGKLSEERSPKASESISTSMSRYSYLSNIEKSEITDLLSSQNEAYALDIMTNGPLSHRIFHRILQLEEFLKEFAPSIRKSIDELLTANRNMNGTQKAALLNVLKTRDKVYLSSLFRYLDAKEKSPNHFALKELYVPTSMKNDILDESTILHVAKLRRYEYEVQQSILFRQKRAVLMEEQRRGVKRNIHMA